MIENKMDVKKRADTHLILYAAKKTC